MKLIIKNHKTGKIYKVEINEKNLDWLESNYNFVSFLNEHPSQDLAAAVQDFADYLSNHHIEAYIENENDIQKSEDKKPLNKPIRTPGENKKFKVYVKDGDKTKTVRFGDPNMEIKRDSKERRSNFRARHNCENPGPKTKARYWSCKMWSKRSVSDLTKSTLEKTRGRLAFPQAQKIGNRPDQQIQNIDTPRQSEMFERKIAQSYVNLIDPNKEYTKRERNTSRSKMLDRVKNTSIISPEDANAVSLDFKQKKNYSISPDQIQSGGAVLGVGEGKDMSQFGRIQRESAIPTGQGREHEAIHYLINDIGIKYGEKTKWGVIKHLNSLIHPDVKQILLSHIKNIGYADDLAHQKEMVPHLYEMLHDPSTREVMEQTSSFGQNLDTKKDYMNKAKKSWKAIVDFGKKFRPEDMEKVSKPYLEKKEKDLKKMSRPRITLPHFKDLPTRPDQNIQGIATPNQKKIFARKIAQAIYPDVQTKRTNVSYSPETKEFNVSEPQQVKVSRQSDRDRQASTVMRDTGKKHFGAVYHGKNYTIGGTTEGTMYSPYLDRNDEYVEAVKQHTQKRNQMVRDYNDQYRAWQSKGWDLSIQHSAENDEAKKFALQTELEEHIKNKPQKPKLPRKPALKSKPVDEKKISLEDYKKRGKGILAVREHEGLHYLLNQVSKKYGGQAYRQTMDHLLSHHDQSALNYIKGFITQVYKYKPGSSGFGEELLAHSRDILVNPKKRGYFVDYLKTKGETKPELVVQALKRGHQNVYNAAQNLKPEHVGIDTGKLAASEDMKKGAARRLYGKFDPVKELDGDNSMSNWVTGNSGIDSDGEIRSKIPNPSPSAKLRATNKLANKTTSRLNPATKQREFLLHRQMSQWEYDKNVKNGRVKHSSNAHTSWTPSLAAITEKSGIYSRDSFDEKDNQSYNTVISAWVPESHIKTIPSQYGRSGTDSPSKRGAPSYLEEHEVIVSPGHNSEVYQILQDTGENKKEWTWRKIK